LTAITVMRSRQSQSLTWILTTL